MGDMHHGQPHFSITFSQPDLAANRRSEDLAATARNRLEPRCLQAREHPPNLVPEGGAGRVEEVHKLHDLWRAERVYVDGRMGGANVGQERLVPLQRQLRIHATLHQDLRTPDFHKFFDLRQNLRRRQGVGVVGPQVAAKRAEGALRRAHIGVVDVAVNHVRSYVIAVHRAAPRVCPPAEFSKRHLMEELHRLLRREANTAGGDIRKKGRVGGICFRAHHNAHEARDDTAVAIE